MHLVYNMGVAYPISIQSTNNHKNIVEACKSTWTHHLPMCDCSTLRDCKYWRALLQNVGFLSAAPSKGTYPLRLWMVKSNVVLVVQFGLIKLKHAPLQSRIEHCTSHWTDVCSRIAHSVVVRYSDNLKLSCLIEPNRHFWITRLQFSLSTRPHYSRSFYRSCRASWH